VVSVCSGNRATSAGSLPERLLVSLPVEADACGTIAGAGASAKGVFGDRAESAHRFFPVLSLSASSLPIRLTAPVGVLLPAG
jgi:hypothetical protein